MLTGARNKAAARRRETVFPEEMDLTRTTGFVNNDRRRKGGPRVEHLEEMEVHHPDTSSVIMLSSAENTLMPVSSPGVQDGSSLVEISLVPEGRATRLTDVDMVLEETELASRRLPTQLFPLDETNTSLVNLDETERIIRDRPKSSVVQRWTRSGSLAPAEVVEARRSSIYSMVTKRNRGRARSVVRNSTVIVEEGVRSKSSGHREANAEGGKDLSQISEEQLSSSGSSGSEVKTPQPFVREFVIQTRTMLRQGKKWSPSQTRTRSASRTRNGRGEASEQKDAAPNKRGRSKQREAFVESVAVQKSVSVSKVSHRKGKDPELQQQTEKPMEVTSAGHGEKQADLINPSASLSKSPQKPSQIDKPTVDETNSKVSRRKRRENHIPEQEPLSEQQQHIEESPASESSSDQNQSDPHDTSQFSNVSKRKRPKPAPDKSQETVGGSSVSDHSSEVNQIEPEPKKRKRGRPKIIPVSSTIESTKESDPESKKRKRGRPKIIPVSSTIESKEESDPEPKMRKRGRPKIIPVSSIIESTKESYPELKSSWSEEPRQSQTQKRGRSRNRTISESVAPKSADQAEPDLTATRHRTRSVSRARQPPQTEPKKRRNRIFPESKDVEPSKEPMNLEKSARTRSASRPRQSQTESQIRGRSRNRTISESVTNKSTKEPSSSEQSDLDLVTKRTRQPQTELKNYRNKTVPESIAVAPSKESVNLENSNTESTSNRSVSRSSQSEFQNRGRSRNRTISESVTNKSTKGPTSAKQADLDLVTKRTRARSASRARQPLNESTKSRGRSRKRDISHSDQPNEQLFTSTHSGPNPPANQSQTQQNEPEQKRRRERAISESTSTTNVTKRSTARSKSAMRTKSPSARSRNRTAATKPTESSPKPATPSRSKSVPRNVLLSPPSFPSTANKSSTGEHHIPIYRRYAEQALQLSTSHHAARPKTSSLSTSQLTTTSRRAKKVDDGPAESDIYMFDSPSQGSSGSEENGAGTSVKPATKGSTAKKRPRLGSNVSRNSKKTPLKHQHPTVFGTDMYKISSVVKRIGGGPVRRKPDETPTGGGGSSSDTTAKNVVHTSTLAAMVQSQKPSSIHQHVDRRSPSPEVVNHMDDDHHNDDAEDHGFDVENIPELEIPTPLSPPRLNPQIQRVLQQKPAPQAHTPDKTQPNASLNFSPLGASSPWRLQNENILPKTFYFARSKDNLPSYESDLVVRDESHQPKSVSPQKSVPAAAPVPSKQPSPAKSQTFARPTTVPPTNTTTKFTAAVFWDIQKSYEQLKATSEMSEKLITAMRKYKSNVYNQTTSQGNNNDSSPEELFAKFREYEENMKKTYLKLKQWYDRSKRTYRQSMKAIENAAPKTQAQQELVDNFRRNSQRFVTMMNDLESAMNDSNIENLSPAKSVENRGRPAFKDIILTDRNVNDRNRSPLKTLDIVNVPQRFSPVKSPLVTASFTSFSGNRTIPSQQPKSRDLFSRLSLAKPNRADVSAIVPAESVIEVADTVAEDHPPAETEDQPEQPQKDLFGFETDVEEDKKEQEASHISVDPTPMKITRETLKERLQSVRKLLPQSNRKATGGGGSSVVKQTQQSMPRIFNSPQRKRLHPSIQSVFSASTPLAEKRNRWAMRQKEQVESEDPNVSAIGDTEVAVPTAEKEDARVQQESPPAAVFDEPDQEFALNTSSNNVNRTYSRIPRRNVKRKRNIYLANLGLSDSEEEEEEEAAPTEEESDQSDSEWVAGKGKRRKKQQKKKTHQQPDQAGKKKRKKKTVEQSAEFQNFVSEFNSMCEHVNEYQWVIEKKPASAPKQV